MSAETRRHSFLISSIVMFWGKNVASEKKRVVGLTCEDKDSDESAAKEQQHVVVSSRLIHREEEKISQAAQELTSLLFFFLFLFLATFFTSFWGACSKLHVSDRTLREKSDKWTSTVQLEQQLVSKISSLSDLLIPFFPSLISSI